MKKGKRENSKPTNEEMGGAPLKQADETIWVQIIKCESDLSWYRKYVGGYAKVDKKIVKSGGREFYNAGILMSVNPFAESLIDVKHCVVCSDAKIKKLENQD